MGPGVPVGVAVGVAVGVPLPVGVAVGEAVVVDIVKLKLHVPVVSSARGRLAGTLGATDSDLNW